MLGLLMNFDPMIRRIIHDSTVDLKSIHGPDHWLRVERNGLFLAPSVGADTRIVTLFAFLHDCRRLNDGYDPDHGPRAARYAESIREMLQDLPSADMAVLVAACEGHTSQRTTDNPTIGVCWDADRLDLPRVGIRPHIRYLHTEAAREMAAQRDLSPLLGVETRAYPSLDTR